MASHPVQTTSVPNKEYYLERIQKYWSNIARFMKW